MYKAILFSVDGDDFVTDYRDSKTVEEVNERLANQGSRWYFYPYGFAIKEYEDHKPNIRNQRILSTPDWPEDWSWYLGKTVRKLQQFIKEYGFDIYKNCP